MGLYAQKHNNGMRNTMALSAGMHLMTGLAALRQWAFLAIAVHDPQHRLVTLGACVIMSSERTPGQTCIRAMHAGAIPGTHLVGCLHDWPHAVTPAHACRGEFFGMEASLINTKTPFMPKISP